MIYMIIKLLYRCITGADQDFFSEGGETKGADMKNHKY